MTHQERFAEWNPARVLEALGRIGYQPDAAILDIVDNSISASADTVSVELRLTKDDDSSRSAVSGVVIADNGAGMDEAALANAISLGSSADSYTPDTLSKYGMGLKAASASLGRLCTITSRANDGVARTIVLDHDLIAERGQYVYTLGGASDDELDLLNAVAGDGSGTIVQIGKIVDTLPSPVDIQEKLKRKAGVTYLYALKGESEHYPQLTLTIDGEPIQPLDPLFESMIDPNDPNLDETNWDGLTVRYVEQRKPIQLTADGAVIGQVTMTQLPHPPSVAHHTETSQSQCRSKYMIGAGNYGFYVYRNGRLIGWSESLGMVTQQQTLYSFRGRFELTAAADDVLNLDVTKSRIHLSDIANQQLRPLVGEATKKSRMAWDHASDELKRAVEQSPHATINEKLDEVAKIEDKEDELDESVEPEVERVRRKKRREETAKDRPATGEETQRVKQRAERVQYVEMLANNQLWERAHDPEHGIIVRVNRSHRMVAEILEPQMNNPALVQAFGVLFFALGRGEYDLIYKSQEPQAKVEQLVDEYRERVGNELSEIIRRLETDKLFGS